MSLFKSNGMYHDTYIKKDGKFISLEEDARDFCEKYIKPVHPDDWDWTKRDFDKEELKPTPVEATVVGEIVFKDISESNTQVDLSSLVNADAIKAFFNPEGKHYKENMEEFAYALDVELEHGKIRDANVTSNHPFLTAMVVLAHMSETLTYYKRLKVMETEAEIFEIDRKLEDKLLFKSGLEKKREEKEDELKEAKEKLETRLSQMKDFPVMKELE